MLFRSRAYCFGDHVNTDLIIAGRYCHLELAEMARHVMEDLDPHFVENFETGGIIVARRNFGCGSSREEAPMSLKAAGVSCIIAQSFARIFYRNCINVGLPILEAPTAAEGIEDGNLIEVDTSQGSIVDRSASSAYRAKPFPPFMMEIIEAGGLLAHTRKEIDN